jgi:hypothetical protein
LHWHLDNLVQSVDAVVGVGKDVLVHLLDSVVVVLESLLDLIGWVLLVFETPGAGVAGSAGRWAIGGRVSIGGLGVMRKRSVGSWGVRWRSGAVAIRWGSGCVWCRCVGSGSVRGRCIGSGRVGSRCIGNDRDDVGWSTGKDSCRQSRENLKCGKRNENRGIPVSSKAIKYSHPGPVL